jgi:hypothetical protein
MSGSVGNVANHGPKPAAWDGKDAKSVSWSSDQVGMRGES